jgi:hypothetical protein
MTRDHYVRFARALALLGATSTVGCYQAHEIPTDGGPVTVNDAGPVDSGPFDCRSCTCGALPTQCSMEGHPECCFRTGPLPPPDLPMC